MPSVHECFFAIHLVWLHLIFVIWPDRLHHCRRLLSHFCYRLEGPRHCHVRSPPPRHSTQRLQDPPLLIFLCQLPKALFQDSFSFLLFWVVRRELESPQLPKVLALVAISNTAFNLLIRTKSQISVSFPYLKIHRSWTREKGPEYWHYYAYPTPSPPHPPTSTSILHFLVFVILQILCRLGFYGLDRAVRLLYQHSHHLFSHFRLLFQFLLLFFICHLCHFWVGHHHFIHPDSLRLLVLDLFRDYVPSFRRPLSGSASKF